MWSKAFLNASNNAMTRAVIRDITIDEVRQLKKGNSELKTSLAQTTHEVQRYKKSWPVSKKGNVE